MSWNADDKKKEAIRPARLSSRAFTRLPAPLMGWPAAVCVVSIIGLKKSTTDGYGNKPLVSAQIERQGLLFKIDVKDFFPTCDVRKLDERADSSRESSAKEITAESRLPD